MGNKKILRGVSSMLSGNSRRRRENKAIAKADALAERELSIREKESALRQQNMEYKNIESKVKIAHGQLVRTSMASGYTDESMGYGSEPMAAAITKYVKDGKAYRHKGYVTEEGPNKGVPIWEVGTYKTGDDGKMLQDPSTGNPIFEALAEGEGKSDLTWKNIQGYTSFIQSQMNPAYLTAMQVEDRTYAQTRELVKVKLAEDIERERQLRETPTGQQSKRLTEAKINQAQSIANKNNADATGVSGDSKKIEQLKIKEMINHFSKVFPNTAIDEDMALKISKVRSDKDTREKVANALTQLDDPESGYTDADFIRGGMKEGLPKVFLEKLIEESRDLRELDKDSGIGTDGWWGKMWNKVFSGKPKQTAGVGDTGGS
jgi:hypothetical protein